MQISYTTFGKNLWKSIQCDGKQLVAILTILNCLPLCDFLKQNESFVDVTIFIHLKEHYLCLNAIKTHVYTTFGSKVVKEETPRDVRE